MKRFNKKIMVVLLGSLVPLAGFSEESKVDITISELKEKIQKDLDGFSAVGEQQKEISIIQNKLKKITADVDIEKKKLELLEVQRDIQELISEKEEKESKKEEPAITLKNFMVFNETYSEPVQEEDLIDPDQTFGIDNTVNYKYSESDDDNFVYEDMDKFSDASSIDVFRSPLDKGVGKYKNTLSANGYEGATGFSEEPENEALSQEDIQSIVSNSLDEKFEEMTKLIEMQKAEINEENENIIQNVREQEMQLNEEKMKIEKEKEKLSEVLERKKRYEAETLFVESLGFDLVSFKKIGETEKEYTIDVYYLPPEEHGYSYGFVSKPFYKRYSGVMSGEELLISDFTSDVLDEDGYINFTFKLNDLSGNSHIIKRKIRNKI